MTEITPGSGNLRSQGKHPVTRTPRRWHQQYDRMKRARSRIRLAVNADQETEDEYYAFFVWCFQLKDWLQKDAIVPQDVRNHVETFVEGSKALRICADVANGVKHLRADRRHRVDPDSRLSAITAGPDATDIGDRIVVVVDRAYRDAAEVADSCIAAWEGFLRGHGLL
jgi:hypothetical protein